MAASSVPNDFLKTAEKIIIGSIFLSILLYFFYTGYRELKITPIFQVVVFLQILLLMLYTYTHKNSYTIFLLGFAAQQAGYLLEEPTLQLAGIFTLAGFGVVIAYKAIKESMANKDLEMYGALLSLELFFPVIHKYFLSGSELMMIYYFALPFVLGIVMFNDNLWDKYNATEKKIFTYILVASLVEVLYISVKLF